MLTRLLSWSRTPSIASASESPAASLSTGTESSDDYSSLREREPVHLPDELVLEILSYFPEGQKSQSTLWTCCLVSHQWHNLAVARLYANPHLYGWNYEPFVRTICPSKNAHIRKSDLAGLVHTLDMSKLAYQGSKSITARVLGRTKNSLQTFVAPAANWGVNCLAALSRCEKLRSLDLSLLSEAMSYRELSHTLRNMHELQILRFPRSAGKLDETYTKSHMQWPTQLEELSLSGELFDFMKNDVRPLDGGEVNLPTTVTKLLIQHSKINFQDYCDLLIQMGAQLSYLGLRHLPSLNTEFWDERCLNMVIKTCPKLRNLEIDKDLVLFDPINPKHDPERAEIIAWLQHPLEHLYVASAGRSARYDRTGTNTAFELCTVLEIDVLSKLKVVTFEHGIKMLDMWTEQHVNLNKALKARALNRGESDKDVGVRFKILQP